MIRPTLIFMLLFSTAALARPAITIPSNGHIPRFMIVADGLYRGGQPTRQGFELLKQRGIKTVVNLRLENDEAGIVQTLGMNYVHIPIEDVRPWSQIPQ